MLPNQLKCKGVCSKDRCLTKIEWKDRSGDRRDEWHRISNSHQSQRAREAGSGMTSNEAMVKIITSGWKLVNNRLDKVFASV